MTVDLRYASTDNPSYEDATKDHVRDWMFETCWIIAESFGADRKCGACQTVMRRTDRRQWDGTGCIIHKFTVPYDHGAPWPWNVKSVSECEHPPGAWVSNADGEGRQRCRQCGGWRTPDGGWE